MRIIHLLSWYFPESMGGTEVYVAELTRRQLAAGHRVTVVAPEVDASTVRRYEWEGAQVLRFPTAPGAAGLQTVLPGEQQDVAHIHSLTTTVGLAEVATARRVARGVVFTAHLPALGFTCQRGTLLRWGRTPCEARAETSPCAACWLESRGMPASVARVVAGAGRLSGTLAQAVPGRLGAALRAPGLIEANRVRQQRLLDSLDYFVALNQQALDIVGRNGAPPQKLVLNRLGIGFRPAPKPGPGEVPTGTPLRVGFIGRMHEVKGLRPLLQALRALPAALPIELEIAGPPDADQGDLAQDVERAAAADPRIVVRPAYARDEIPSALRRLDVLCCPSTWFENGPTVALEAHAVGTPVIGTDFGAMREFITDGVNGRLVPVNDWRALCAALQEVATDTAVVDRWRARLPPPRTMDDVAGDYDRLYRTCVG